MANSNKNNTGKQESKVFKRSQEDVDLKQRLLLGPEQYITEKGSDAYLDKLAIKIQLRGGQEFILADYVSEVMAEYESKFSRAWYYRLADLFGVSRKLMDPYVKPEFVRQFTLHFVYARFPQKMLRALRSKNRTTSTENNRTKLFQHMTKSASEQLDIVIEQVFEMMGQSSDAMDFKMKYSHEYKVYFQTELFV